MTMTTTTRSILVLLLSLATMSIVVEVVQAKELVATHEWQRVGPDDTLPAGLEIRMDLEHGGTWVRIPPPPTTQEEEEQRHQQHPPHVHRCGPSCHERLAARKRGLRGGGGGAATTTAGVTSSSTTGNTISNHASSSRQVSVQDVFLVLVVVTLVGLLLMFWKSRGPKLREL